MHAGTSKNLCLAILSALAFAMTLPGCRKQAQPPTPATVPASAPATTAGCLHTSWRPTREAVRELNLQLKRGEVAKADEVKRWLGQLACGRESCVEEAQSRFAYAILPAESKDLLPAISDALSGGDSKTRMAILMPLSRLGKNAAGALPGLRACLDDQDKWVSAAARDLVAEIDPKP